MTFPEYDWGIRSNRLSIRAPEVVWRVVKHTNYFETGEIRIDYL